MGHEPVLIPDISLITQLAIFLLCSWILNQLVFKPYLALLKLRKERTDGLREKAAADRALAEKRREELDEFLKAERKRMTMWSDVESKKAHDAESQILAKARSEAAERIAKSQAALETASNKVQGELDAHAPQFASLLIEKLLDKKVPPADIGAVMVAKKKTDSAEARN